MNRHVLILTVVAVCTAGCGGPGYKIAPVSGRVTLDGKPLADAAVQFYPEAVPGSTESPGPTSIGHTDGDGRYTLVLVQDTETNGAVVGKHKVFINLTPKMDPNDKRPRHYGQLPMRYNRRTELVREVPAEGGEQNFELTSKP